MPKHVVVDGSNIATEGRSMPSLTQLNEAVMAFMAEHPESLITVVVDATFGHRIDAKEVPEFDEAVANNELVAPPAGAVGRGDAFVLLIADKVNATILSNDSFQEFHGQYDWLFDGDRLIGGKPVPHIGWVFVNRVPARGPVSRSAMKEAKRKKATGRGTVRQGSPEASKPMPVPKAPPPKAVLPGTKSGGRQGAKQPARVEAEPAPHTVGGVHAAPAAPKSHAVNDVLPFLAFVEHHPVGSSVNAVVETYSSHGAYVRVGDVKGYVPLRLMADPAPRSAREFMKIGDAITLVVESFAPARRSVDLAVVGMATPLPEAAPAPARRTKKAAATPAPAKKGASKKAAAPSEPPVEVALEPAAEVPAGKAVKPAKKPSAKKAAVKSSAKKADAEPAAPTTKRAAAKAAPKPVPVPVPAPAAPVPAAKPAKKAAKKAPAASATAAPDATAAKPARSRKAAPAATEPAAPAPAAKGRRRSS